MMDQEQAMADFMSVMSPGHFQEFQRELADRPTTFNNPDDFFNREPPSALVSFIIGGVLSLISFVLWIWRVQKLKARSTQFKGYDYYRGLISCAIDNDEPYFTIPSFAAISFLFLGGIQLDYQTTLLVMVGYYIVVSFSDSLRVLITYWQYESLGAITFFSKDMDAGVNSGVKDKQKKSDEQKKSDNKFENIEIQPKNVYEDMGREQTIVFMIFATQIILVAFVCIDIYNSSTVRCLDGTADCPVAGTMGSYLFYCMGIFQACVYLLGPKTNFGQSEQNPGFWLVLLLASKKGRARLLWENPAKSVEDTTLATGYLKDSNGNYIKDGSGEKKKYFCCNLNQDDFSMWLRFFMSYLVNGVFFHILVYALPIQVASQSSFTGVVFRAVGMLYLVDLDDTKGFKLIISGKDERENETDDITDEPEDKKDVDVEQVRPPGEPTPLFIDSSGSVTPMLESRQDQEAMTAEANEILKEAEEKLELLRSNGPSKRSILPTDASVRIKNPSVRINMSFGCTPNPSARKSAASDQGGATQAALLQASADTNADAGGGGGGDM